MAGARELLDGALAIGLGHVLDKGGFHLAGERRLDRLAALIVLVAPAEIADRANIDEADLELLLRHCCRGQGAVPAASASAVRRD